MHRHKHANIRNIHIYTYKTSRARLAEHPYITWYIEYTYTIKYIFIYIKPLITNCLNTQNQFRTGKSYSKPEILEDGRIRLVEQWQGITGNQQSGVSILEEIKK